MNILLIDDGTLPLSVINKTLCDIESRGEKCEFINTSPANADKIILSEDTDLILLNSALFEKISHDVLDNLKQRDAMLKTPIVCFSASPSDDEEYKMLTLGARDYIRLDNLELASLKLTHRIEMVMFDKQLIDSILNEHNINKGY